MKKGSISYAINLVLEEFFLVQKDVSKVSGLYKIIIEEVERTLIKKTMILTGKNKKQTAEILGISRNTLSSKLKYLNLENGDDKW